MKPIAVKLAGNCGSCFKYHKSKGTCPLDGKKRTTEQGCFENYLPEDDNNGIP